MSDGVEPFDERRKLAVELRRLRSREGMSGRDLASRVDISQSKVSRIESGNAMPTRPEVERWADATNATPEERAAVLELTEHVTEIHAWRTSFQSRPHRQHEVLRREARARMVRNFEPLVVPGLLQTAEYARQVFDLSPLPDVRREASAAIAGRMDRQLALYERDRRFEFLICETALRWRPGPDAHRVLPAQLDRIVSLSTLENLSIGVIPEDRHALTYASHGFVIYEGHDPGDTVVSVEAIHAGLVLRHPDEVELYQKTWAALTQMAIFGEEARRLVDQTVSDARVRAE